MGREQGVEIEIKIGIDDISRKTVIEILAIENTRLDPGEYNGYRRKFKEINEAIRDTIASIYNAIEQGKKVDTEKEMEKIKPHLEEMVFLIKKIERDTKIDKNI